MRLSEKKYQIKVCLGLVVVAICSSLYAWGGMEMKFLRRFIAPCIAAGFLAIINKEPLQLIKAPLLGIASSLGYGAGDNEVLLKIAKRAYVGLAFGIGASITDIIKSIRKSSKHLFTVGYTFLAIVSAFIIYGVWNPVHARVEETILGAIIYLMAILPSIKE